MQVNRLLNQWIVGCTESAEVWNGRLAMLSFSIIFLLEYFYSFAILRLLGFV